MLYNNCDVIQSAAFNFLNVHGIPESLSAKGTEANLPSCNDKNLLKRILMIIQPCGVEGKSLCYGLHIRGLVAPEDLEQPQAYQRLIAFPLHLREPPLT